MAIWRTRVQTGRMLKRPGLPRDRPRARAGPCAPKEGTTLKRYVSTSLKHGELMVSDEGDRRLPHTPELTERTSGSRRGFVSVSVAQIFLASFA